MGIDDYKFIITIENECPQIVKYQDLYRLLVKYEDKKVHIRCKSNNRIHKLELFELYNDGMTLIDINTYELLIFNFEDN